VEITSQLSQWNEQSAVCLVTLKMGSDIITVYGVGSAGESDDYADLAQMRALRLAHQLSAQGLGAFVSSTFSDAPADRPAPQTTYPITPPAPRNRPTEPETMSFAPANSSITDTEPAPTPPTTEADEEWGEVVADEEWGGLLSGQPAPATPTLTPTPSAVPDQPPALADSDDDLALIIG
jgi:hypothetical protein